ncbi:MAG: apolipoprotein N-acyltransferase [Cellvibrionales bacterium TMED49]|nr:apolipoprotein N-acyltransferase [Porticoccaceae bacterium]OUU39197.1 MAG: apolipoprotein N-acyltransferase [Cellvibrionales bacterium TMED49]
MVIKTIFKKYLLLMVAGCLVPLGLAPYNFWIVTLLCLTFLYQQITAHKSEKILSLVIAFNLGAFLSGTSWVFISMNKFGFVPVPYALTATFLFCLFLTFLNSIPFAIWRWISQNRGSRPLVFSSLWVLGEWLRSWFLTGFPWLLIGYSQSSNWLSGWATIGGIFWVSFISALIAACIWEIYRVRQKPKEVIPIIILISLLAITGMNLLQINWTKRSGDVLTVALIQPNINQLQKWSPDSRNRILNQLSEQSSQYWDHNLIIWPEAAVPTIAQNANLFLSKIDRLAKETNTTLITGIPTYDPNTLNYHNSALALGGEPGQYNKTKLVPFGEYVPLENLLRGLIRFFDLPMSNFSRGEKDQNPLSAQGHKIASAICYEVVYPDLVANNAIGASLILTMSNDAWFGDSLALPQHLQMAQMRAIESSKPILRATNNGLSAIIDHKGRITHQLDPFISTELSGIIQPMMGQTPFSKFGSVPCIALCVIVVMFPVSLRLRKKLSR